MTEQEQVATGDDRLVWKAPNLDDLGNSESVAPNQGPLSEPYDSAS